MTEAVLVRRVERIATSAASAAEFHAWLGGHEPTLAGFEFARRRREGVAGVPSGSRGPLPDVGAMSDWLQRRLAAEGRLPSGARQTGRRRTHASRPRPGRPAAPGRARPNAVIGPDGTIGVLRGLLAEDARRRGVAADRVTDWLSSYDEAEATTLARVLAWLASLETDDSAQEAQLHGSASRRMSLPFRRTWSRPSAHSTAIRFGFRRSITTIT
jgi:hypothetical protein